MSKTAWYGSKMVLGTVGESIQYGDLVVDLGFMRAYHEGDPRRGKTQVIIDWGFVCQIVVGYAAVRARGGSFGDMIDVGGNSVQEEARFAHMQDGVWRGNLGLFTFSVDSLINSMMFDALRSVVEPRYDRITGERDDNAWVSFLNFLVMIPYTAARAYTAYQVSALTI
jgi:hypothetical protein